MPKTPDIALLKLPNHNVDYPSLSIPTLTRALRKAKCSVFQDDLNVRLRDFLLTERNMKHLTYGFLPEAGKHFLDDPEEFRRIKSILGYLTQVDSNVGFASIEATKELLLAREYEMVFSSPEYVINCSLIFIVESIFHNIIDFSIKCEELDVPLCADNLVTTYLEGKVHEIAKLNPRIIGFSIMDIQRTTCMCSNANLKLISKQGLC